MEKSDTTLPCTPPSAKFVCLPTEVNTHRELNLDNTLETQQTFNELCEEYKNIFSLHQGDIGHTKFLIWILIWEIVPIKKKPYKLPLQYLQWVHEELEMLEKAEIISQNVSTWVKSYCYCTEESSTRSTNSEIFIC